MIEFTLQDGTKVMVDHRVYLEIMKLRRQLDKLRSGMLPEEK